MTVKQSYVSVGEGTGNDAYHPWMAVHPEPGMEHQSDHIYVG